MGIQGDETGPPRLHPPAMVEEVLEWLQCRERDSQQRGPIFLDMTVGTGGHAAAILQAAPSARVIGMDKDAQALSVATQQLEKTKDRVVLIHGDFRQAEALLTERGITQVDGCLLDAGISLWQIESPSRGFSFRLDGPLDMRMNCEEPTTAANLVHSLPEEKLFQLFRDFGIERRWARAIARSIVAARSRQTLRTTLQLAAVITATVTARTTATDAHPATKAFAALRVAVNREFEALDKGIRVAAKILAPTARVVILAYNSGEERAIKAAFHSLSRDCSCPPFLSPCRCGQQRLFRVLTRKPIQPSQQEIRNNPRSRSCKLRVAEKCSHSESRDR